jgi:hypothetical protein
MSVALLAGCSRLGLDTKNRDLQAQFDTKLACSNAAQRMLNGRGDGDVFTSKSTYIQESFYSPTRNSCVAVLILTTGDLKPLSSGGMQDTLSDTYDIVDTLTYQSIRHISSGIGPDRTKTSEEVDKDVAALKGQ